VRDSEAEAVAAWNRRAPLPTETPSADLLADVTSDLEAQGWKGYPRFVAVVVDAVRRRLVASVTTETREQLIAEGRRLVVEWLRQPAQRHNYDEALVIAEAIERGGRLTRGDR
jgi:hypothetical protein